MIEEELIEIIGRAKKEYHVSLDLCGRGITSLPKEIGNLSSLKSLYLHSNQLTSIPAELGNLSGLQELYLHSNHLTSIPAEFGNLSNLKTLDLSFNQLRLVPIELGKLSNLIVLELAFNQLTSIPAKLGNLSGLQELYLHSNQLTSIPVELGNLSKLKTFDLSSNQLIFIPAELGNLSNLTILNLLDNLLTDPSPEIVNQGTKAVSSYLRAKGKGRQKQWISKLVVVGQGGVGKTQMLRQLRGENFDPSIQTTHGIDIHSLKLPHPKEIDVEMELKAWDFGGQEIYHATHQFFFSNRSLFILVWNAVHEYEQGKLYKWLDNIQAIAPDSPILIVATHIDQRPADLPISRLKSNYIQIKGHFGVSSSDNLGFEKLINAITEQAARLPLMGQEWPKSWIDASKALREKENLFISRQKIPEIFKDNGVEEKESDTLLKALHELGDILYFHEDDELKDIIILKPQWVSKEVSKVLDSQEIQKQAGVFKRDQMDFLWREVSDFSMRNHLLRLMEKFDLSYRIPDQNERSLVVECLPLELPNYREIWKIKSESIHNREISIKFVLNTMPPGIPTWFIARSHRFTTGIHWRGGAVFNDKSSNWALVEADEYNRTVQLTVRGSVPHNFFAILKDGFENTLSRYPGLNITRRIPCPGHYHEPCRHEFDHRQLIKAFEKNRKKIECPEAYEDVSLSDLLLGWEINTIGQTRDHLKPIEKIQFSLDRLSTTDDLKLEMLKDDSNKELLSLLQLNLVKNYNSMQSQMDHSCPNIFTLRELNRGFSEKARNVRPYELQLYCQAPGKWHPVEAAKFKFDQPEEWLVKATPYINGMLNVWKFMVPLAGPGLGMLFDDKATDSIKNPLALMEDLTEKKSKLDRDSDSIITLRRGDSGKPRQLEESALIEFRKLLDEIEPDWRNRGLKRILTPEGHYLWLCNEHAKEYLI
jgi:internalin A